MYGFNDNQENMILMETLYSYCEKQATLSSIKLLIDEHGLIPDQKCIQLACKHKNYIATIKYFITNFNLIIDRTCIKNSMPNMKATPAFILSNVKLHSE
jgi:hypothetical protein